MHYFLFDIDGTLLRSGGAGRVAMTQVMIEMFNLNELKTVDVHGRTDRGIITELFQKHELPFDDATIHSFASRYHELLPNAMRQCEGSLLPGARTLIEKLSQLQNVELGILTGNSKSAADTKLQHFDLRQHFHFGGYGEAHANRDDVANAAITNCREVHHDREISDEQVWVVGDTRHDITCARSIGANVLAVTTGGADGEELMKHHPNALLDDLSKWEDFYSATGISAST